MIFGMAFYLQAMRGDSPISRMKPGPAFDGHVPTFGSGVHLGVRTKRSSVCGTLRPLQPQSRCSSPESQQCVKTLRRSFFYQYSALWFSCFSLRRGSELSAAALEWGGRAYYQPNEKSVDITYVARIDSVCTPYSCTQDASHMSAEATT